MCIHNVSTNLKGIVGNFKYLNGHLNKEKTRLQIGNRYYRTIIITVLNALVYASFNILIVSNDEHAHIVHTEHLMTERKSERMGKKDSYIRLLCVCVLPYLPFYLV